MTTLCIYSLERQIEFDNVDTYKMTVVHIMLTWDTSDVIKTYPFSQIVNKSRIKWSL